MIVTKGICFVSFFFCYVQNTALNLTPCFPLIKKGIVHDANSGMCIYY
jgi:hypothetical protein